MTIRDSRFDPSGVPVSPSTRDKCIATRNLCVQPHEILVPLQDKKQLNEAPDASAPEDKFLDLVALKSQV